MSLLNPIQKLLAIATMANSLFDKAKSEGKEKHDNYFRFLLSFFKELGTFTAEEISQSFGYDETLETIRQKIEFRDLVPALVMEPSLAVAGLVAFGETIPFKIDKNSRKIRALATILTKVGGKDGGAAAKAKASLAYREYLIELILWIEKTEWAFNAILSDPVTKRAFRDLTELCDYNSQVLANDFEENVLGIVRERVQQSTPAQRKPLASANSLREKLLAPAVAPPAPVKSQSPLLAQLRAATHQPQPQQTEEVVTAVVEAEDATPFAVVATEAFDDTATFVAPMVSEVSDERIALIRELTGNDMEAGIRMLSAGMMTQDEFSLVWPE